MCTARDRAFALDGGRPGVLGPLEHSYFDAEFASVLRRLERHGGAELRFLEIGFGDGALLAWARERGFRCSGVELDPRARAAAASNGFEAYASLDEARSALGAGALHLAAAFDVLEHLEREGLPRFFGELSALLAPGGLFVARFPNGDSPFGRMLQHGDLAHATTIGSLMLATLARDAGLSVVSLRDPMQPAHGLGAVGVVKRVAARVARRWLEAALRALYYQGRRFPMASNAVAVFEKPG